MTTENVETVVAYRLMRIEQAQEKTSEALDSFRDELKNLATRNEVIQLETRLRQVEDRISRGWITPSMVGAIVAGGVTVVAQMFQK